MSGGDGAPRERGPWWRQVATILAVASLLVTLVFNALGVWQGAQQDKQARRTEQIGLLTGLNEKLTSAEADVNASGATTHRCDSSPYEMGNRDLAALRAALSYYEYLAWLYNSGQLKETDSRAVFAERLIDGRDVAKIFLDLDNYPELRHFAHQTKSRPCP